MCKYQSKARYLQQIGHQEREKQQLTGSRPSHTHTGLFVQGSSY